MRAVKGRKLIFLLQLICVILVIYFAAALINLQIKVSKQDKTLAGLSDQKREQQLKNQEIERLLNADNQAEYAERIARDKLNHAYPEEKVIINESGN